MSTAVEIKHTPTEQLAAWISSPRELSAAELGRAQICLEHFLACALASADLPWVQAARPLTAQAATPAGVTALGWSHPVTPEQAVFDNALRAQSTLLEDVLPNSLVHPASMVFSAALAAGDLTGSSLEEVLHAAVVGYDVIEAVGTLLKTPEFARRGIRPSGAFGPLGAAAAVASILHLPHAESVNALAIAANTGAGLREWATAGSDDIYIQNGLAARNGYTAAMLAALGLSGPRTVLEGPAGLAAAMSGPVDWNTMTFSPGIVSAQFKRFPACSGVQAAIQAATEWTAEHGTLTDVDADVLVRTHHHGKYNPGCDSQGPWAAIGQAQMSGQLGVAFALLGYPLTISSYQDLREDPRVTALVSRIRVEEDPAFSATYPAQSGASVEVLSPANPSATRFHTLAAIAPLTDTEAHEFFVATVAERVTNPKAALAAMQSAAASPHEVKVADLLRHFTAAN